MKIELHAHTSECDKVAHIGGAELVKAYQDVGYGGIVITDHYFSLFFDWFKDELQGADHQRIIERYLKGYYAARNEGEKIGFRVLSGAEVRFNNTINDYLVYGLEESDFYSLPLLNELKSVDELVRVLPDYAVVVQAHPFRNNMTVTNPDLLFGIEAYNGGTDPFRNEMAKIYATHYNKTMTSGSDIHDLKKLALGGIVTEREVKSSQDLVDILRSGSYSLIENGK